ncbi:MAG: hypothetical protein ACRER4_00175 [Steroidobacteraceae bacterium]
MKSPIPCRSGRPILYAREALLAAAFLLAACAARTAPEDEIRALIATAETAAEDRDASSLRELIADDYRDGGGRDADELRRYLHGYLIAHQSIRLITRIDAIELEGAAVARAQVTVGMLGRETDAAWEFAADIYHFDLRLAREDGDWRVTRAGWRPES